VSPAPPLLIVPALVAAKIRLWGTWGPIEVKPDPIENLVVVNSVGSKEVLRYTDPKMLPNHYLQSSTSVGGAGWWYEVETEVHALHFHLVQRSGLGMETSRLKSHVKNGWRIPPVDRPIPVLAWSRDEAGTEEWSAWWVDAHSSVPGLVEVLTDVPPFSVLQGHWPVDELSTTRVVIVGLGSIGSVIAETLADFAIAHLDLVDPDRLYEHNLARHRLGSRDLGRHKVNALTEYLMQRHPELVIARWPCNVIVDADVMRPLFAKADLVVGATDGVASRRVINHLARRAGVPAVLACVLEDGALGEIVRVRRPTGCLSCYRETLEEMGSLNPEPNLDAGYGTGTAERPMTAVGGDLVAVGALAAKVAVATLLEQRGHWDQRLPGDVATIGLQPVPNLGPPFDIERAGDVRWDTIGPSRPECTTCTQP